MTVSLDYSARIKAAIQSLEDDALLVLAQPQAIRNSDVGHVYRQESFLHYLTGLDEPQSALLILPRGNEGNRVVAFVRPKDPVTELWDGRMLGVDGAKSALPVDQVFPIGELWQRVVELVPGHHAIHYHLGRDAEADRNFVLALRQVRNSRPRNFSHQLPVIDSDQLSGQLRQFKSHDEVQLIREAARITGVGFDRMYRETRPGMNERQIHGMLISEYMTGGAEMEAYGSIVAGGSNACILHYVENCAEMKDGDLLLVDSGAQYRYYASDVTRTFPIGKKFTSAQRDLYQVVLEANEVGIAKAAPEASLPGIHSAVLQVLTQGLVDLKLLKGDVEALIREEAYKKYYPHNTSHWLGMDVHDVGAYRHEDDGDWGPVNLASGMLFTVEPGLYIPESDESVPADFRGIGIRIEDDILVTSGGNENLTAHIPKDIGSLENRY